MEYWTVLWITILSGYLEGTNIAIPYTSLATCEAALNAVSDTLPYDHSLVCEEGNVLSASIRPQRRPEGLVDD